MGGSSALGSRWAAGVTGLSYAGAVSWLTWLIVSGPLSYGLKGSLTMLMMALPSSLLAMPSATWIEGTLAGGSFSPAWESVFLAAPGIAQAVALAAMLGQRLTRVPGLVIGWLLTVDVAFCGWTIAYDEWAPRGPYGWLILVCGAGMAAGLVAARFTAGREDSAIA
ncbi:hypothetical protein HTZ77_00215 [Nonomuraea sp. SMC257]|uniref:Uncharacterized protein n=1 Tax=Nonomuraea montanisoli TaxID=2741721 RepID=A0A7Y6I1R7_9ACTN|nr:hypothetical protein [Nonomuraea montanisoli]NUW29861.1 hypothetical protein [Nonomuraea montanisoli]